MDSDYPAEIAYNILNLPANVYVEEHLSTSVIYLADGTKTAVMDDDSTDGVLYYGPFRCDADSGAALDAAVPGGRGVKGSTGWEVRYFTADHLGSTRVVTDIAGTILEQFDYLPYGERCINSGLAVANTDKTDYLYGGKEKPQLFGIDWYDSVARWLTTSGIFVSPDPLMEKYYSISPYAYCAGNPVNLVDPDGKIWETALDIGSLVMGVKSFTTNVKEGNVGGAIVDGLGIVADAIAVATPFVPGVASAGIAAARGIDKGADALKGSRTVYD